MDLFGFDPSLNLLPYDGEVNYYGEILSPDVSDHYLQRLCELIAWKNDEFIGHGKHVVTNRLVAWYGDVDFHYTYSKKTRIALPWTRDLIELKTIVERKLGIQFNSCLANLYHNGGEGVSWHSDDEYSLDSSIAIASLTFGASRKFSFKHKSSKETVSLSLDAGSLLVMRGETQRYWLHSLPKTTKVSEPRINLTFRVMK